MAQAYTVPKDSIPVEDIGRDYIGESCDGSFFEVVERDEFGRIKTCKMHHLMHDLATKMAGMDSSRVGLQVDHIDEKTRHMSFDFHASSSWDFSRLFHAKGLRTFLLPGQKFWLSSDGKWEKSVYEAFFSKFKNLYVLDLHNFGIVKVPSCIKNLKHLRYLDFSQNDEIKVLPDSITMLLNLQVLNVSKCEQLKELPKDIKMLINLRHLYCDGCWNLMHMPRELGELTQLQTLTWFVVAEDSSFIKHTGDLKELTTLNN